MLKYDIVISAGYNRPTHVLSSGYDTYEEAEEDMAAICYLTPWGYMWGTDGFAWDAYIEERTVDED